MKVVFEDDQLARLDKDPGFTMALSAPLVKKYRMRMQTIRAALDERDFYAQKALRYEKLKGKRRHQRSMRLNDQFRLVLEVEDEGDEKRVRIVGIEDYH
jgi:proteic killer suppression protein